MSDFVYRKNSKLSEKENETIWLVLYNCLAELCVDPRPPVRKSACQTLLQTISAHGHALKGSTWKHMIWKVVLPCHLTSVMHCYESTKLAFSHHNDVV